MHLTMDFETRSEANLKKCGTWAYSEHPSTRPMCLAFKPDDLATRIWVAPEFLPLLDRVPGHGLPLAPESDLLAAVTGSETVEAHNSMFEYAMWELSCRRLFGWPELPLDKMRCSAAKAAAFGYPRSLEQAARTARIGVEKDKTGYALMMKWCKPRKPTKDNPSIWADDPHEFVAICRYCIQDVEVEYKFSKVVPDLTPSELATWKLDQRMNAHGLRIDMPAIQSMLDAAAEHEQRMLQELRVLTGGRIDSVKKVKAMVEFINERLPDDQVEVPLDPDDADSEIVIKDVPVVSKLTRDAVKQALGHPSVLADHIVKRVLEIRQSLSLSSVSKYLTLQMWANEDFIVRNLSRYYGAITGRWAGQGVQPHNLPRGKFRDVSACVQHLMTYGLDSMAMWWGDPMIAASTCIRAMLIPRKGKRYIDGDFKSVEAVTTAWLAGEEKVLNVFRSKLDLYRITAVEVFGGSYETVKSDERQIGKVVELACFAGESLVLTACGWKRIDAVSAHDLVWDGCEFVGHGGVVSKGSREVMDLDGVRVTADHLFLVEEGIWVTAEDIAGCARSRKSALAMARSLLPESSWAPSAVFAESNACVRAEQASSSPSRVCGTGEQRDAPRAGGPRATEAECGTPRLKLRTADDLAGVSRLSSAGVSILPMPVSPNTAEEVCQYTRHGSPTAGSSCAISRGLLDGMTHDSRSTESTTTEGMSLGICASHRCGNSSTTRQVPDGLNTTGNECPPRNSGAAFAPGTRESGRYCGSWQKVPVHNKSSTSSDTAEAPTVYDILNCGPRNRFFVLTKHGPLITHNCGFQGWVGAFQSMAAVYGVHVPDERAAEIILAWREARPAIANMWAMAEHAAMMAFANPGTVYRYRHVAYCYTQGALKCKLPSGRLLYYHWPRLVRREDKYKRIKTNLTYMTTKGGKWIRVPTYGGKLVENFVQATARDLLVSAMHRVDAHPAYTPVLSVHDELLSEVSPEDADLDEYCGLMSQLPAWAEGLPLESDGWIDDRFRKG